MNMMFTTDHNVDWEPLDAYIQSLIQEGLATRTFRRLDAERRQAVLQALLDEAGDSGPAELNVHRVARRAGVSVGSLYQYFGEREQMLTFIIELCLRYTLDTFAAARPDLLAMPLRSALEAYLSYGVEWTLSQAGLLRLFVRAAYVGDAELVDRLVAPVSEVMRSIIADLLQAAAERGELRPGLDLDAASRIVHAMLAAAGDCRLLPHLNAYYQVCTPEVAPERSQEAIIDLIMSGIRRSA